ncbi:MAG: 16S rRNA (guanine(527)-N(7))-methyltransferase RsmG [Thermodesulfobacteriota bacterium]
MDKGKLKDTLAKGAGELGVELGERSVEMFITYLEELKKWNKKINLTSLSSDHDIVTRHFLDSLTPLRFLGDTKTLLDIGSGGGFPGIPLKIASPGLDVTLVEATEKKVHFLRHIIRLLDLGGIRVMNVRAEDGRVAWKFRRSFDCVTSRAFTDLRQFLGAAWSYVSPGGIILAMKGPKDRKLAGELESMQGRKFDLHEVDVPFADRKTTIVVFHVEHG